MKNIYKIKLILIALVVFTSCAIDNDDPVTNLVAKTELSLNSSLERVAAGVNSYDLVVNVAGDLPYSSRLTYTLDGQEMYVDVNPQASTATITVDMSSDDVRVVTLTKVATLYSSAAGFDVNVSSSNNTTAIARAGVGENGDMYAQMTWSSDDDIDLLLTRDTPPAAPYELAATTSVAFSLNVGPLESITLPGIEAEGDYSISIIPYEGFTAPVDFRLLVIAGTSVYNFDGSMSSGLAATGGFFSPLTYATVQEFAACVKTGTGTDSTYTLVNKL